MASTIPRRFMGVLHVRPAAPGDVALGLGADVSRARRLFEVPGQNAVHVRMVRLAHGVGGRAGDPVGMSHTTATAGRIALMDGHSLAILLSYTSMCCG
ncbi:MAG: hypothetical protein AAFS10_01935, partial [Myxococcota bacterium]